MRALALCLTLALIAACGDESDSPDARVNNMFDAPGGTPDAPAGTPDAPAGTPDANGSPPVITMVSWEHEAGCQAGVRSDVTVTVTVTDADTAGGDLGVSGSVSGCLGALNALVSTVSCPQAAPYGASVTVTDPENNSDTQGFTVGVCADGTAP